MVCKEGAGGGPREAIPGGIMGGRRACVLTKGSQRAVEGGGERTCGLGNQEGHRVTAALGIGVVVVPAPPVSFYRYFHFETVPSYERS